MSIISIAAIRKHHCHFYCLHDNLSSCRFDDYICLW